MPDMPQRYAETFKACREEGRAAFIPFWMLGDPDAATSQKLIETIAAHADILELGLPFSDPLADGPTIQASVNRALEAGMNTKTALDIISNIRTKFPDKPIGLLVYLNLILAFGVDRFFEACAKAGVDSVLIPELPIEEVELVKSASDAHGVDLVFLVSTNTPQNRREAIYRASHSFIYAVSTPSITGGKSDVAPETLDMIAQLKTETDVPIAVGFGISSPEQVKLLSQHKADGVIIGSKLFDYREDAAALAEFCAACHKATYA